MFLEFIMRFVISALRCPTKMFLGICQHVKGRVAQFHCIPICRVVEPKNLIHDKSPKMTTKTDNMGFIRHILRLKRFFCSSAPGPWILTLRGIPNACTRVFYQKNTLTHGRPFISSAITHGPERTLSIFVLISTLW